MNSETFGFQENCGLIEWKLGSHSVFWGPRIQWSDSRWTPQSLWWKWWSGVIARTAGQSSGTVGRLGCKPFSLGMLGSPEPKGNAASYSGTAGDRTSVPCRTFGPLEQKPWSCSQPCNTLSQRLVPWWTAYQGNTGIAGLSSKKLRNYLMENRTVILWAIWSNSPRRPHPRHKYSFFLSVKGRLAECDLMATLTFRIETGPLTSLGMRLFFS